VFEISLVCLLCCTLMAQNFTFVTFMGGYHKIGLDWKFSNRFADLWNSLSPSKKLKLLFVLQSHQE